MVWGTDGPVGEGSGRVFGRLNSIKNDLFFFFFDLRVLDLFISSGEKRVLRAASPKGLRVGPVHPRGEVGGKSGW
jgi:hypothetical protein